MSAKIRPGPLEDIEDNGAPVEVGNTAPEPPMSTSSKKQLESPQLPLSPMSRFSAMNANLEGNLGAVTSANKSAKKLSVAASAALGAFLKGGKDHDQEIQLCHVAQELLCGARKLQVKRMRELLLTIPQYEMYSGLVSRPKGDEFEVTVVIDPYGKNEKIRAFVSPSTTLGELYDKYPVPGCKFERVGIMIQGYQAPVGYRGFQLQEFEHLRKAIEKIFLAPMQEEWSRDKVLDSPSAHAYNTLEHGWYERK